MDTILRISVKIILVVAFGLCLFYKVWIFDSFMLDIPYGYFQLVRIAGFGGFIWLAYKDSSKVDKSLMIVWIISALLINPFLKVQLGRHIWNFVDVVWAIVLLTTIWWDLKNRNQESK